MPASPNVEEHVFRADDEVKKVEAHLTNVYRAIDMAVKRGVFDIEQAASIKISFDELSEVATRYLDRYLSEKHEAESSSHAENNGGEESEDNETSEDVSS